MSYIGNSPGVASQRVTTTLTATAAQTQFTTQSGYVLGYVDVYLNGAKLVNGSDFEAITGTYITLFTGALAGDIVELISYVPRGLSDGYTKAEADSKFLDVGGDTATGNLSFATATLSGDLTLNGSTANGVAYLNGSKVVVAGSALTFNGTVLAAPTLNLTNALGIAYGGTGQTTANAGLNALLPTQTGNATKYLQTDGSNATWDAISISTADITGTLPVANGGTGATTAAGALTSLGAYAASNPSGYTTNLGTVTSVAASVPAFLSVAGSPITTSGTLAITLSGTALPVANGGTGLTAFTTNGVVYASSTSALTTGSALTYNAETFANDTGSTAGTAGFRATNSVANGYTALTLRNTGTSGKTYEIGVGGNGTAGNYQNNLYIRDTSGNPTFYLNSTGIGVNGTFAFNSGAATTVGGFSSTGSSVFYALVNSGSTTFIGNDSTSGSFVVQTPASSYSTKFVVTTPGNVGIGLSVPEAKLDVIISGIARLMIGYAGGSNNYFDAGNNIFRAGDGTEFARINSSALFVGNTQTNTNSSKLVVNGTISQTVGGTQYLVVDQSDVGTAPNQIPLNQYLGSMAFQDRENINFTGGTGALSSLDIAAISAQLNVSAVDVFVYDTSKDSDGGAWRKRTQHTSWYNETLNTTTRGARREFPAVAVIVATQNNVTIYDADSPDLPMWMVFTVGSAGMASTYMIHIPGNNRSIYMLNAVLVEGTQNEGGNYGNPIINFISEKVVRMDSQAEGGEGGIWLGNIADRNTTKGYAISSEDYDVGGSQINDLAMTVLPNAPVDLATGLPIPTIAVATSNGVSVIKDNGTVTNLTWAGAALRLSGFNSDNAFCAIYNSGNTIYNVKYKPPYNTQDTSENYIYNLAVAQGPSLPWNPGNEKPLWGRKNEYVIGTTGVLRYLGEGSDGVPATRIYNAQTSTYSSGFMVGDIKGAWLSDTAQETIISPELVTNGTFDNGLTGWTTSGSTTPTISSGGALITTGVVDGEIFQTVSGNQQRAWVINWTITSNSGGFFGLLLNQTSTQTGGTMVLDSITTSGSFVYSGTITSIAFRHRGASSGIIDNISIRIADPDRSPNFKALQVFGTITKTPVATGADLVAYSGFSSSNYLEQPYNSALDFGTGDFSYIGWYLGLDTGTGVTVIFSRGTSTIAGSMLVQKEGTSNLMVYVSNGSAWQNNYYQYTAIPKENAHMLAITRTSGVIKLYVDGVPVSGTQAGGVGSASVSLATQSPLRFGGRIDDSSAGKSLALWRASATAPSDAQILKMYEDEKVLFQENSKATLYGTSDAVTALAYDTDTQLLHVGTSSGRSVFDGLRRIENTTTAVATAISAADGLVVEN